MSKTITIPRERERFTEVTALTGSWSHTLAVKVSKRLTKPEGDRLAQIVGYAWRAFMRAESLGAYYQHGHDKIVFWQADTTKTVRDDVTEGWRDFLATLPRMVREGTPIRKTDRAGANTKGTRLVEGLGPDVTVTVYADQVEQREPSSPWRAGEKVKILSIWTVQKVEPSPDHEGFWKLQLGHEVHGSDCGHVTVDAEGRAPGGAFGVERVTE